MRLLVVFTCVAAVTTGPALAGPRNLFLVVRPAPDTPELARARTPAVIPDVRTVHLPPPDDHLTFGDAPKKPDPDEVETPWFWRALREQVHTRLPRYEQQRFSLVVSPVIVKSPSDTIPGLGVGGVFLGVHLHAGMSAQLRLYRWFVARSKMSAEKLAASAVRVVLDRVLR